eukprot:359793-Chlamydomonas_euryale.AAC.7
MSGQSDRKGHPSLALQAGCTGQILHTWYAGNGNDEISMTRISTTPASVLSSSARCTLICQKRTRSRGECVQQSAARISLAEESG